ncbi:MAG TPA: molybdopterin-dependent oxidoreductase [Dongiaceae bacterium]|nr:molybdopterin-dependent oxidoreductase [Dongiaceae bacterium]
MQTATQDGNIQVHYRTCNICEASCGLEIRHRDGQILSIKGDVNDPLSQGHICPKGVALQDLQEDPDRLRKPLKKVNGQWQEIGWPQALDEVAARIRSVQNQHGNNAMGLYVGNPTAHNHGALLMLAPFIKALNTRSRFSATSCDQLPHMLACLEVFGHFANFPIPDIDRTQYFLCLGANPLASNGSVMTAPNFKERLKLLRQRGGRFVVFDPRRTETAEIADEHHFIRPGTDSLLLLALLHVVFAEGLVRLGAAEERVKHLQELEQACAPYTPVAVSAATGVSADVISRLAREFAAASCAAAYGRVGVSTSLFSGLNAWLIYVLNIVTGNLDCPGGLMFPLPAIDLVGLSGLAGETGSFDTWRSRVRQLPEFAGEIPVATMADEILTPGPGQIRGMIVHAGNPVLSVPNGKLLEQAFQQLDLVVSIDIYLNETSRLADYILPPTGPLEHGHYELGLHGVAIRNTVKYSPPLLPKPADALHDWQILAELTARLESGSATQTALAKAKLKFIQRLGDEGLLDWLIKLGPYGKGFSSVHAMSRWLDGSATTRKVKDRVAQRVLRALNRSPRWARGLQSTAYGDEGSQVEIHNLDLNRVRENPHGVDLGALRPLLSHRIFHRDGLIDLAPALFVRDLPRLQQHWQNLQLGDGQTLQLIGRRHVRSNNSWMHNSTRLTKGKNRCNLMMHPDDAQRLGLHDDALVWVESAVGRVQLPLWVSDAIMPGVVSMPHGYGHNRDGVALEQAVQRPGVSMNDITDHRLVDGLTGMAVVNGVPVKVFADTQVLAEPVRVDAQPVAAA